MIAVPWTETFARPTGSPLVALVTRPAIWRCCAHARGVPTATSSASETSTMRCTTVPPYLVHGGTSSAARNFNDRYVARDSGGPQGGRRTGTPEGKSGLGRHGARRGSSRAPAREQPRIQRRPDGGERHGHQHPRSEERRVGKECRSRWS